jgi:enoyl-CoA hydratase/carnithine racemase
MGEVMRIALLGLDERMSAKRALEIGLVSEVLPREELWDRGAELARLIASKPPAAVQGTVRAVWESLDSARTQALRTGRSYTQIGNPIGQEEVERSEVPTREWVLR